MNFRFLICVMVLCSSLFYKNLPAQGFGVEPLKLYFTNAGKDKAAEYIKIRNTSSTEAKNFKLRVVPWDIDSSGTILFKKDSSDFSDLCFRIDEDNFTLQPDEERRVKVIYEPRGQGNEAAAKWGLIEIDNLPSLTSGQAFGVVNHYVMYTHVYHTPDNLNKEPDVVIKKLSIDTATRKGLMNLANNGEVPGVVEIKGVLQCQDTGAEIKLTGDYFTFLPQRNCIRSVQLPQELDNGSYVLQLIIDKGKEYNLLVALVSFDVENNAIITL